MTDPHPQETIEVLRARLADAEARLQGILSGSVDALIVVDEAGLISTFSAAAERMFGFRAADVVGHNVSVLMPYPERTEHDAYMGHYMDTGERRIIGVGREVKGQRADGSLFPLDLSVGEMQVSGRRLFVGILRDLSERNRIRDSLHLRDEQFRLTFYRAPIGCMTADLDGRITSCNPAFASLMEAEIDTLVGRTLRSFLPIDERQSFDAALQRVLVGDAEDYTLDRRYVRPDGRQLNITMHVALIEAGTRRRMLVCQVVDRTQQVHAETEAQEQRERLAHFDRLTTMGEMASGIAHEINQPLTAISAYAQAAGRMLQAGTTPLEELLEICQQIAGQAQRAGEVIKRLRSFVKKGDSRKEILDVTELLGSVRTLAEVDARHHDVRLESEFDSALPPVYGDPVQIQQVVLNLVRNGIDAMEDARTRGKRAQRVSIRARRATVSEVEVSVADEGAGISAEARSALFTPFFTTKRAGMGLGLSISNSIVVSHGGRLWFSSNPRGGTIFHFTLPVAPGF